MPRRILQGTVVSDSMDKSITVQVRRKILHPLYKKFVTRSKKFIAHDAANTASEGDKVYIRECRPISKRKSWELITDEQRREISAQSSADSQAN